MVWPDDAPPREQYDPLEAQRVVIHYTRWLAQRTQRTQARQGNTTQVSTAAGVAPDGKHA